MNHSPKSCFETKYLDIETDCLSKKNFSLRPASTLKH